jgi:integrase
MKAWDISEVKAILTHTRTVDFDFYFLLLLAITHGLRVSEVINLRKCDFIIVAGKWKLRVQRLKGSLETTQLLHHDPDPLMSADEVAPRFLPRLGTGDFLFFPEVQDRESQQLRAVPPKNKKKGLTWAKKLVTVNDRDVLRFQVDRLVEKYCHAVGIGVDARDNRDHIHCAKHSLGVMLAAANRPILEIAKALGHKNINSSAVYCGTTDEQADKARDAAFAAAGK